MERSGLFALPTKDAVRSPADGDQGGAGAATRSSFPQEEVLTRVFGSC